MLYALRAEDAVDIYWRDCAAYDDDSKDAARGAQQDECESENW